MKLIVQIPCFNEERALEEAYRLLTQGLVVQQNQGDGEHASRIVRTGFQQSSGEEGDDSFADRRAAQPVRRISLTCKNMFLKVSK